MQGYALDLAALLAEGGYGRVSLPTYPFARQRYWVEARAAAAAPIIAVAATSAMSAHTLKYQMKTLNKSPRLTTASSAR